MLLKKRTAIALLAILAAGFAVPEQAEARRYRPVVRRAGVVYVPVVRRAPVIVGRPVVGVGVGYGSVRVVTPRTGVFVGW
jgi:hypothetical protein